MATIAAVAAGGSLGTLARYGLDVAIERRSFSLLPWSTFAINLSGCFLVGLLIAALVDRHRPRLGIHTFAQLPGARAQLGKALFGPALERIRRRGEEVGDRALELLHVPG